MSTDLVDTTQMYLKAVWELEEEGIKPIRARLAERLDQSKPTVSETVARLVRDGYVTIRERRVIELTHEGRSVALRIMRKHRLAEVLLYHVVGLAWEDVHEEACRWEHVMSVAVADKIAALLPDVTSDPYGNPVPAAWTQPEGCDAHAFLDDAPMLGDALGSLPQDAETSTCGLRVVRISELTQVDRQLLADLRECAIMPGQDIRASFVGNDGVDEAGQARDGGARSVRIEGKTGALQIPLEFVDHIHVRVLQAEPQQS
ncbi:MAG: metal-dependent transcriptional regulator [Actinomycetaceae bacterium]|nr:metal-dependent transcriptional regulator [Actinomycetaceae bacterium]MDY6082719.1 metal-dependent transcriptional regulator [Actinomycetaceae bacterium]